jgi:predicted NodU family carbamoyl transferase
VLVADGRGESGATSIYAARHGAGLTQLRHWPRVCSLGIMYEAAGHLLGFGGLEAGKTMGLAPTASPPARTATNCSSTFPPTRPTR